MPAAKENNDPHLLAILNSQVEELLDIKSRLLEKRKRNKNQDGDVELLDNLYRILNKMLGPCRKINMSNYDTLTPFITDISSFLQNLLSSFTNDFIKYDPIASSKTKKQIILDFTQKWQERCLLENNQSNLIKEFSSEIDSLLWVGAKLRLHHLSLLPLDEQIERLEALDLEYRNQAKHAVINNLKMIRSKIKEDVDDQYYNKKIHSIDTINQSPAIQFACDTADTFANLTFDPKNIESETVMINNYADTYKTLAAQEPKFKNFGKSIGTLLVSLAFLVVSGTAGAVLGFLTNPWAMYVLGAMGSMVGAEIGLDVGKELTGIPKRESVLRHLFFRPTVFYAAGMNIAKKTEALLNTAESKTHQEQQPLLKKVRFAN